VTASANEGGPQLKTVGALGTDLWNRYKLSVHIESKYDRILDGPEVTFKPPSGFSVCVGSDPKTLDSNMVFFVLQSVGNI